MIDLTCSLCGSDDNVEIAHRSWNVWEVGCKNDECGDIAVTHRSRETALGLWADLRKPYQFGRAVRSFTGTGETS